MAAEVNAQDLDVEELTVTSAVLAAGAHHYGTHCKDINETFMRCRMEKKDPRKCLNEGKEVHTTTLTTPSMSTIPIEYIQVDSTFIEYEMCEIKITPML